MPVAWPSMKPAQLLRLLKRELEYEVATQRGSHKKLVAEGRPTLIFAFHDDVTVPPRVVRDILVRQVGLTLADAEEVIEGA